LKIILLFRKALSEDIVRDDSCENEMSLCNTGSVITGLRQRDKIVWSNRTSGVESPWTDVEKSEKSGTVSETENEEILDNSVKIDDSDIELSLRSDDVVEMKRCDVAHRGRPPLCVVLCMEKTGEITENIEDASTWQKAVKDDGDWWIGWTYLGQPEDPLMMEDTYHEVLWKKRTPELCRVYTFKVLKLSRVKLDCANETVSIRNVSILSNMYWEN
jgi:hypothetical protein